MSENFHIIETKIYDSDGDLIKWSSHSVDGDYEYTRMDKKYLDWLDERRNKRTIVDLGDK